VKQTDVKQAGSKHAAVNKGTPIRHGSPLARPAVYVPLAVVLLAVAGIVVKAYTASAAADSERAQLIADIESEVQKQPLDSSELSKLVVRLQKLPDHETARDLLAAAARIELARDHPKRAVDLFGALASQPGASAAEQRLGARILLRLHETGAGGDVSAAGGLLQQVMAYSEAAYADGRDPADLLRAWQAATRLWRLDAASGFGKRILEEHADSPAGRLVQLDSTFVERSSEPGIGREVEAVAAAFVAAPVEVDAMRVLVVLGAQDAERAVTAAKTLLTRAPGVWACHWVAALVYHVCSLAQPGGSAERQQWVDLRNAQLDWLLERVPEDQRERYVKMRAEK
jgi:hypothetical protein